MTGHVAARAPLETPRRAERPRAALSRYFECSNCRVMRDTDSGVLEGQRHLFCGGAFGLRGGESADSPEVPWGERPLVAVAWAMPSRWTFQIPPIADFVQRWTEGRTCIVDPFCGTSLVAHHRNDMAHGGMDAEQFVRDLIAQGVRADCVIFDPPYSPRQIAECYKSIGRKATTEDTQNARLYKRVRDALADVLVPGGVALSFGWQSSGFGKRWLTHEILLVQHGGAHNDTICVAQVKP